MMSQDMKKGRYFSCLLRLWQTQDGAQQVWRASVEFPATGERHGFASLDELFAYLEQLTSQETDSRRLPGRVSSLQSPEDD